MISDRGLDQLRLAATLVHLHPTIGVHLGADGRTVARVAAPADGDAPPTRPVAAGPVRQLTPCAFRAGVARAWAQHRTGQRLRFLDLAADPTVALVADGSDAVGPGGIVRVAGADVTTHAFTTFLGPDRCREHGRDLVDGVPAPEGLLDLVLRRDSDTGVTVVSAEVDPDHPEVEPEVIDVLEGLLARFVAVELLDAVVPAPLRP